MGVSEREIRLQRTWLTHEPPAQVWALRVGDTFHVRSTEVTRAIKRWDTLEDGSERFRILRVKPVCPGRRQLIELTCMRRTDD